MTDPRTFHITQDREGFYVADDDGCDVEPTRRWSSHANAKAALDAMVAEDEAAKQQEASE